MSPLKDTQPVASNPGADTTTLPPVKPTAASTIDGSENLPAHVQKDWTEIQKRGHLGSGIFDEQKAPPVTPMATKPDVQDPISGMKMFANRKGGTDGLGDEASRPIPMATTPFDPSHLTLPELRTACRDRGLNPGGGKDALSERLVDAINAGTCAPFLEKGNQSAAAGMKRQSPDRDAADAGRGKIQRTERVTNPVTNAPNAVSAHFKQHKADVFLTEMMNSPKRLDERKVTVSDAKLRDLGVGTSLFAESGTITETFAKAATLAGAAKAKEHQGHGDLFMPMDASVSGMNAGPASLLAARPTHVADLHKQSHSIFETEGAFGAIDPHELAKKQSGSRVVSAQMKQSLFQGSGIFDAAEETKAAASMAEKARTKDSEESRVIAHAHYKGHGIFSSDWVVPKEVADDEAIDADVEIEPAVLDRSSTDEDIDTTIDEIDTLDTAEDVSGFKPIGACPSPLGVELRWKTEAEEEREYAVATLVYEAIRRVVDKAAHAAFYETA